METSVRFFVQIFIEGKGWVTYATKNRVKRHHTLTLEESAAYLDTLDKAGKYRIVKSVKAEGLVNQEVVGYQIP